MRNKLRYVLSVLSAVLFITAMLPIYILADETDEKKETTIFNEMVQNYFNEKAFENIPNMLQAAIKSGDVYDISQLYKLNNIPSYSENAVYIIFTLEGFVPVGATSYEITDEIGPLKIQGSELNLPDGYELVNPDESQDVQIDTQDGSKSFNPNVLVFTVRPVLPDPLPVLNIRYVDNGTTVYTEKKTLEDFEKTRINANLKVLDRLGYKIGESSESNTEYLDIFKSIFGATCQETSYIVSLNDRIPLIPSDFLVWYDFMGMDIPFALSGNTFEIEVDKEREVDLTVDIVFETKDFKKVGETYHLALDPLKDYLTVNKDNLPPLPVGYKLVDSEESHTAFWEKEDGVWVIKPKTLVFIVESSLIDEVPDITIREPLVLSGFETITPVSMEIPITSDNTNFIVLYLLLGSVSVGCVVLKKIKSHSM